MARRIISTYGCRRVKLASTIGISLCLILVVECFGGGIHDAAKNNDIEKIKEIISNGGNVNAVDKAEGFTALHFAAQYGNYNVARLLLDAGADLDIEDNYGRTPVDYTVFDVITWNKRISHYEGHGMDSLRMWHQDVFELLIERNPKVRPERLLLNAVRSNDPKLLDYIISRWNVLLPKDDGRYVYNAVGRGAHESLKWLIEADAELNEPHPGTGFTPLHIAARHRNFKATKMLLNAGAAKSLSIKDNNGKTPIEAADEYFRPTFSDLISTQISEGKPRVTGTREAMSGTGGERQPIDKAFKIGMKLPDGLSPTFVSDSERHWILPNTEIRSLTINGNDVQLKSMKMDSSGFVDAKGVGKLKIIFHVRPSGTTMDILLTPQQQKKLSKLIGGSTK